MENGAISCSHKKDNSIIIEKYSGTAQSLEIPDIIDNAPVTEIGRKAFLSCKTLKEIIVPGTVTQVGDWAFAHAEALKGGLSHVFAEHGIEGIAFGSKTCPLYGIEVANTFHNSIREILSWLEKVPSLKTVIIMCRWDTRLSGNHSNQILYRVNQPVPHDDAANSFLLEEGLTETCRRLRDMGRDVVLVGPVPLLKLSPGTELRRKIMLGGDTSHIGEAISLREFEMKESPVFQILQRVSAATGARVVPVHPCLEQKGYFRGFYRSKLLYHDDNHLSYDGAEYVSSCILPQLIPLMDHQFNAM